MIHFLTPYRVGEGRLGARSALHFPYTLGKGFGRPELCKLSLGFFHPLVALPLNMWLSREVPALFPCCGEQKHFSLPFANKRCRKGFVLLNVYAILTAVWRISTPLTPSPLPSKKPLLSTRCSLHNYVYELLYVVLNIFMPSHLLARDICKATWVFLTANELLAPLL